MRSPAERPPETISALATARLTTGADGRARCWWCGDDPTYVAYHDDEWGRPLREERALYELLVLEGFQAGLAWITVLRKRPAFRAAFEGFEPERVAAYGPDEIDRLVADAGIIRHRGKCEMAVGNARALLALHDAGETLAGLCEEAAAPARRARPAPGTPLLPTVPEAERLSKHLRRLGFRFVGPTVLYAFWQSAGFVDDHLDGCWVPPA